MNVYCIHWGTGSVWVLARSWYDAKEYARSHYGDCDVTAAEAVPPGVVPERVEGTKTTTEIAREHGEALYALGKTAGLQEAARALAQGGYSRAADWLSVAFKLEV